MSKTTHMRIYRETAELLAALSDEADVPRPSFVAKLAERYGEQVARELGTPGTVSAEPAGKGEVAP